MGKVTAPVEAVATAGVEARGGTLAPDEIDLRDADPSRPGDLLGRVAVALASTLELREVLRRLARIGHEASGARHCSLFLLEGRDLVPAVAIGGLPDGDTWRAFKSMGPVPLDPARWRALVSGKPVALAGPAIGDLVPTGWVRRFGPGSLVLVPLMAEGIPCGLMAVDWAEARAFEPDELALLEAIGTAAGVAVRNARLFEDATRRAQLQEALTRAAAALASPLESGVLAERLVAASADVIGARLCAIGLLDSERQCITTVASRGSRVLEGPIPLADIPPHVVERAWRSWERAKVPIEFGDDPWFHGYLGGREAGAGWYMLCPLVAEGHTRGFVLMGFEASRRLDVEARTAVRALVDMASTAVERGVLLARRDRRLRQLDALYRVSADLADGADAATMVAGLRDLLSGHGVEVESVGFCDDRVARRLGADVLSTRERALAQGKRGPRGGDSAVVPMYLGQRLYGGLRVRPGTLDSDQWSFLEALARGIAEIANRDEQRVRLEEAARERAIAAERDRMACDLHDTAGQVFVAMGLLAHGHAERLDPGDPTRAVIERIAELSDRGKNEIDHAARALAFVPATRRGLVPSLKALAADVERDSGIRISLAVTGRAARLVAVAERALYRVAHEATANAWRHADCGSISIDLDFGADEVSGRADVVLSVTDDGVGVPDDLDAGRGLKSMERALAECAGSVAIEAVEPEGTAVVARVPRKRP